jgi:hypothetical protein
MMSRLKHADWHSTADKAALLQALWQLLRPQLAHAAPRHCAEAMLTASRLGQQVPEGLYQDCMQQFVQQVSLTDLLVPCLRPSPSWQPRHVFLLARRL